MKALSFAIASTLAVSVQAQATQFNAEDIQNIKDFKFDFVKFLTKKDCALDPYPDVSVHFYWIFAALTCHFGHLNAKPTWVEV